MAYAGAGYIYGPLLVPTVGVDNQLSKTEFDTLQSFQLDTQNAVQQGDFLGFRDSGAAAQWPPVSGAGQARWIAASGKALLSRNGKTYFDIFGAVFNVLEYGADPTGATDSLAAFVAANSAALSAGGGTVWVPRGFYQLSDRFVLGAQLHWVDEKDITIANPDYTAAASFNVGQFNTALGSPQVHMLSDGAYLWGNFVTANNKAVVWACGSRTQEYQTKTRVGGFTIIGQPGANSSGTVLSPSTAAPPATNVDGLFFAGTALAVRNVRMYEINRALNFSSAYWSSVRDIQVFHCVRGCIFAGMNAVAVGDLKVSYASANAFEANGQGGTLRDIETEECATSLYIPDADGLRVSGTYFEAVGAALTDYQVKIGDGVKNVVECHIENSHLSSSFGRSCHVLNHAQLSVGFGSHWYPDAAHGLLIDSGGVVWKGANSSFALNVSSDVSSYSVLAETIQIPQGIRCAGSRDLTNSGGSGIVFGRAGFACDPATNLVGLYQDNSSTPALRWETFSGRIIYALQNAITAHAGGGQASAVPLLAELCIVSTCATAADSVLLPSAVYGGMKLTVFNLGANACAVFPATGGTIDALAINTAFSIPAGSSKEFWAQTATQWRSR